MTDVGDIIEIPYQEGICIRCGWVITREDGGPWTGSLGGDCPRASCGEHDVIPNTWKSKTRKVRVAESITISIAMMDSQGNFLYRSDMPGTDGANWQEFFTVPVNVSQIAVSARVYRYNAAVD
jgi:hypothetical protein